MKSKLLFLALSIVLATGAWAGWTTQESGTTQEINAICFATNTIGFAAGNSGTLLGTTNGTSWTSTALGTTANLYEVFFVSSTKGYVLGATGEVFVTTSAGIAFSSTTIEGIPLSASFRKGSAKGENVALAAYDASTGSYIAKSADSGTNWTTQSFSTLEATGVFLGSGEGSTVVTWAWGKYSDGRHFILKNGSEVWSNASTGPAVKDLFFTSKNVGYAVGENGLILKASSGGGNSSDWLSLNIGLTKTLNAVYFITDLVGWAVGESGTVIFTVDGGASWTSYVIDDTTVNIKDIFVRYVSSGSTSATIRTSSARSMALAQVLAYLSGSGGKVYKLSSPTVSSLNTVIKKQCQLGTAEVTGKGFISGLYVNFLLGGTETTDKNIGVISTSVEGDTKVKLNFIILPGTQIGSHDALVTNPDGTAGKLVNALTVEASTGVVSFESIWLDLHKYTGADMTVTVMPITSYEVVTTAAAGLTPASMNARLVTEISTTESVGSSYIVSIIPVTAETQVTAQKVHVYYQIPSHEKLPDWTKGTKVRFVFYTEDNASNAGLAEVWVWVAQELQGGENIVKLLPGTKAGIPCYIGTVGNVDPEKGTFAWIRIPESFEITNFSIKIVNAFGKQIYTKAFQSSAGKLSASGVNSFKVKTAQTAQGEYVTQYSWFIPPEELKQLNLILPNGIYSMLAVGDKGILAKNYFVVENK